MWEYYLFAMFVFVLCAVLVIFAKFLFSAKKKPEDIKVREEKLLRLYRQLEDMMESFEEYAEEVREDISESKKYIDLQIDECEQRRGKKLEKEISDKTKNFEKPVFEEITSENIIKPAEKSIDKFTQKPEKKSAQAMELEKLKNQRAELSQEDVLQSQPEEKKNESRQEKVLRLYKEGKSENKIAKEMNMNSSEVKLIIQMNLKQ